VDAQDPITALQVRWDFDGDGTWDTDFSTQKAQGYFFRNPGNFITKLEVLDSEGLTGSTSKLIKVLDANIKPNAVFKVDPQRGTTETLFTFDASGSTDPEDASDLLTVRWDWDNDGFWDTESRTQKIIQHRFTVAGNYTVVVEVMDTEGFASTFSKQVTVTNPNTAPTADFSITPITGTTETEFEFNASLSTDAEDNLDQLEVRWDWNNDDVYDTEFTTEKIIRRKFSVPGTYIIMLQVRDSGGLTDTKARLLVIE
jgi:PKD repeat protein